METIKEAATINAWGSLTILSANAVKNAKYKGFIDGVAWAERWIPVEEELPPIGKNVTILLKGEDENGKETFNIHTFDKIINHKRLKGWFDFYDFTHWRPINHE